MIAEALTIAVVAAVKINQSIFVLLLLYSPAGGRGAHQSGEIGKIVSYGFNKQVKGRGIPVPLSRHREFPLSTIPPTQKRWHRYTPEAFQP